VHDKFKVGFDIALAASDKAQREYARQYKKFNISDEVLILLPDFSHKLST